MVGTTIASLGTRIQSVAVSTSTTTWGFVLGVETAGGRRSGTCGVLILGHRRRITATRVVVIYISHLAVFAKQARERVRRPVA